MHDVNDGDRKSLKDHVARQSLLLSRQSRRFESKIDSLMTLVNTLSAEVAAVRASISDKRGLFVRIAVMETKIASNRYWARLGAGTAITTAIGILIHWAFKQHASP